MSTIKILPETLSNKIAAGEVVERPASVVKELIENALDAGSTRVMIEVEKGGRSLIRVSDNGSGMTRDDALLAIERYATSKIYSDQDLFAISTLGFRGEALPSMAAVSRFALVTRPKTADAGTGIFIEGGKLKKVTDVGAPVGTMVTVKQLFFNTPARRKFLKTIATEMGHISDTVAAIALGRPDVRFRLRHNKKTVKNFSAADAGIRVADVLGRDLLKDLHKVEFNDDAVSISGWISAPRITRSTAQGIYVYVNGRPVRDRVIQHALMEGYSQRLMKGRFPMAVLFIAVPFDQVDVNVHPTKNEVRLAHSNTIHDAVQTAVSGVLNLAGRPQWIAAKTVGDIKDRLPAVAEPAIAFGREPQKSTFQDESTKILTEKTPPIDQPLFRDSKKPGDLSVIGQFHGTYILCEAGDELILVDQHAAHERIRFEQLTLQAGAARPETQKLLVPETIDLGYREAATLLKLIPDLEKLGLEIEPFGGNTFVIKSVPALLAGREIAPLIIEMAETLTITGFGAGLEKALEQCLIIMACHGTIRANQPLSATEMQHLLKQLAACDTPSHCPHGRPTWIRWTLTSLEKSLRRIV
jgi:DNA mismatch repair protein MutL